VKKDPFTFRQRKLQPFSLNPVFTTVPNQRSKLSQACSGTT
jgi:hypothetical protein